MGPPFRKVSRKAGTLGAPEPKVVLETSVGAEFSGTILKDYIL